MISEKSLIILNGSPRKNKTSYSFACTIKNLAECKGCNVEILHTIDYFSDRESLDKLKEIISKSDIIGFIAPLYVDTLPYHNIWLFEKLYEELENVQQKKDFFAIGQCGFPDITRCKPLIESCRFFAEAVGMNWLGGLSYGGGSIINGALLENLGKKGEKITRGFELAIDNIINGQKISNESQELLTIKIPKVLYRPMAAFLNHDARKKARDLGSVDFEGKVY
jgi:hypothetical protein